ncbi:putative bifunctional diguanylate cyclase/phosphodiesterase [Thiohalophilus thiocyanatoxydans]|uniref:Diguanylate cyclase/phosphodiesterase n=1 Tax=Thiohalophilus thiocyanatoxydans TaxID=381308 RepID=A0A4R8IQ01_9GAMM|nr:bifunctional diguanylate cyclase/phosphodiesterase [Thiohalophilus thiocyanatoxydans]TDY02966.1 diguanylate cyclase/phosphodiesterase [Thiohalophilus thiocyanatoxydans]
MTNQVKALVADVGSDFLTPLPRHWVRMGLILIFLVLGVFLVYATGGAGGPYTYALLFPILVAGFFYGVTGGVAIGVVAPLLIGPWMPFDVVLATPQTIEQWLIRSGAFLLVGSVTGVLFTTLYRRQAAQLAMMRKDPATGLPNQAAFQNDLDACLAQLPDNVPSPGVALIRATDLAEIVDILGLEGADHVMRKWADQINRTLPELGGLYRFSSSELGLILPVDPGTSTRRLARQIHDAARASLEVDDAPVRLEPAIGVGHAGPDTGVQATELIRRARVALHRAQTLDRDWVNYEPSLETDNHQSVTLIAQAEEALEAGEFELHFQPKVRLSDRQPGGVEGLIRWRHPENGLIPPGQFMPKLEQTSLIEPFSRFVIRQAVELARSGLATPVSLNLATRNLADSAMVTYLLDLLRTTGTDPASLLVEVTEGGIMREPDMTLGLLHQLRDSGVGVSIDDFGTGYASFAYLRNIPATELKIDRSFVSPIVGDERVRRMVSAMIEVGHALGMKTTAEGVETEAQASVLAELGCELGQGFLWSPALPEPELQNWIAHFGEDKDEN